MRAARIHGYNEPPVVEDTPLPEVGPGEVLVRVPAASLNPLDVKMQLGYMHEYFPAVFPYVIGTDLAGTIDQVGADVSDWKEGDNVLARVEPTSGGALAEYAVVPATHLVAIPEGLSFEHAAGLPTTAGTAWQALFEVGGLEKDQTILIHAGAGGVGSLAVQLAHAVGARVVSTASGGGVALVQRLGADQVIDYRAGDFAAEVSDVDLVLDTVGGDTQVRSVAVLRPGGSLIVTPQPPGEETTQAAKARDVKVEFVFHSSDAARLQKAADGVAADAEVVIDRVVPLDNLPAAFEHLAAGHAHGKVVLTP